MRLTILHTNDFHGTLDDRRAKAIRAAKEAESALYFDSGDCIKAGNLAVPTGPDPAWERLAMAGCDASVPGNRETHPLAAAFRMKMEGARHSIVCANLHARDAADPFPPYVVLECQGQRIGVLGAMVPMELGTNITRHAWSHVWEHPVPAALRTARELRPQVDLVVALTHVGIAKDRELASGGADIDLILGGHSHTVLEVPERVGATWICQGGSHGKFMGRYVWESGAGIVEAGLTPLPA